MDNASWSETLSEKDFLPSEASPSCPEWMRADESVGREEGPMPLCFVSVPRKGCCVVYPDLEQGPRSQDRPRRREEARI